MVGSIFTGGFRNKRVLDVGCGSGELITPFATRNDCYGIDIVDELVQVVTKKGVHGIVLDVDSDSLPFDRHFFDIVFCCQVIEHLINTDHVLSEINRVLKPGRFLVLSFPNVNQPASLAAQLFLDYPPIFSARYKSPHVRDFTLRTAKTALSNNGFQVTRMEGTTIFPFKNRFAQALAHKCPRWSERIVILSVKASKPTRSREVVGDVRVLPASPSRS